MKDKTRTKALTVKAFCFIFSRNSELTDPRDRVLYDLFSVLSAVREVGNAIPQKVTSFQTTEFYHVVLYSLQKNTFLGHRGHSYKRAISTNPVVRLANGTEFDIYLIPCIIKRF